MNNTPIKNKKNLKLIAKIFAIFLILFSTLAGLGFTSYKFADSYRLGYDFKGYYSSRVAVHNINNEQLESNQPNGDAREAAGILSDRLNPLGMLDIKVQVAGANYLRVDAPIDSFVNEIAFKNELQKTGGVMIFDQNYNDAQGDGEARKPLSDLIVTANDSAVTIQNKKVPTIEFGLTEGGAFSSMISALAPSGEDGQATAAPVITIVTDVDSFLNDVRSSYLYSQKEDQSDVLDDYYTYIIKPFQDIFVKQDTSEQIKAILADYFLVSFKEKNTNGTNTTKYFNLLSSSLIRSGLDIEKYIDTLEFVNSTNKYVYDSNAKGDDFKDDGKYSGLIDTVTIGDGISTSVTFTPSTMKINEVFNNLNKTVYSVINAQGNNFEKSILNEIAKYTIFAGEVATSTGNGQLTSNGTIVDDKQFIAVVTSASVAKSGATIFNAAGKGFTFNVSSLTTHEGAISNLQMILGGIVLIIIAIALLIFMLFLYRIIGLFAIIIAVTSVAIMLFVSTLFNLEVGPELIIASTIIVGINFKIATLLFDHLNSNYYNKKRGIMTAFNIANKETLMASLDILFVILITNMSLFWVSTASIKIFATALTVGAGISVILNILVSRIFYKLLISTNIFNKNRWLFTLNTDSLKDKDSYITFKIFNLKTKIELFKNDEKKQSLVPALEDKLKILEDKLKIKQDKRDEKFILRSQKLVDKLKKQLEIKKVNVQKLDNVKKIKKITRMNFQIQELEEIIELNNKEIQSKEILTNTLLTNTLEEKRIIKGSKLFILVASLFLILAGLFGGFLGMNYDNSFGRATEYTVWGSALRQFDEEFSNISANDNQEQKYDANLIEISTKILAKQDEIEKATNSNFDSDDLEMEKLELIKQFFVYMFENSSISNGYLNENTSILSSYKVDFLYGLNYQHSQSVSNIEEQQWITINLNTTNKKESRKIKNIITRFSGITEKDAVDNESGFTSKELHPYSSVEMIKELSISMAIAILVLLIYIVIRFKWTYYIAMVVGALATIALVVGVSIVVQIPIGIHFLLSIAIIFILSISGSFITLGKANNIIRQKNDKSISVYYTKEIELTLQIKNKRKEIKDQIFELKKEYKIWKKSLINNNNEEKAENKKQIKLKITEYKKEKTTKWNEFRKYKKEIKQLILKESKKNNYLKDVYLNLFKKTFKNIVLVGIILLPILGILTAFVSSLMGIFLPLIVGYLVNSIVVLLIVLPLWSVIEQRRMRSRLSQKQFINNLKVTGEEELIEGINK